MVRVTFLSPTKNYSFCSSALAHLELLILQSLNIDLLLEAIIGQHTKQTRRYI